MKTKIEITADGMVYELEAEDMFERGILSSLYGKGLEAKVTADFPYHTSYKYTTSELARRAWLRITVSPVATDPPSTPSPR